MTETRQVYYERFGTPPENLQLRTVVLPEPPAGHALVRILKVPVHPADLAAARGAYGGATEPGFPGIEALAEVETSASGQFPKGARVAVGGAAALWADYAIVDEAVLLPVPDGLPDAISCQLFVNPLTARLMLTSLPAEGFSIQAAANSALGRMVNRIAQGEGRKLINLVRRQEAADVLLADGARHVVNIADPDWQAQVRAIAGSEPITGALDPVANTMSLSLSGLLSPGGQLTIYGGLDLVTVAQISLGSLIFGDVTVKGFWLTRWMSTAPQDEKAAVLGQVIQDFAAGRLNIEVDQEHEIADFKAAVSHAENHKAGKILFSPDHSA